jgi:hypothetical protein
MPAPRASTASGWRLEVAVVLGVLALLGLLVLPLPFTGDQALFAAGARQLADGDVLYRDFWDVKQPGIYAFYLAGGSALGYSEVALHLAELVYQLAFAVVLIATLRDRYEHRWVGPVVALLIVGTYYAAVEAVQLGQVESLVGFPAYLALWCAARGLDDEPRATRWFCASGVAGGVVLVLKLVLAPVLGGIWLVALWHVVRHAPGNRRAGFGFLGAIALGVAIPVGLAVVYLAAYGQLETARWTFFTVSSQATGIAGRPLARLTEGASRTAARWALPLALGTVGLYAIARRGRDRFDLMVLAWLVLGVPVFLVQHWWIYTYAMFLVPVGLLAGRGIDLLAGQWSRPASGVRVAALLAGVVLLVPVAVRVARNTSAVARHGFALSTEDRTALREDLEPEYGNARAWARRTGEPDAPTGDVYVLGNPLDLYVADRRQSVSINGWSPEQYPEDVWRRLRRELRRTRPVELVVDRFSDDIMEDRSRETRRLIASRYEPFGGSGDDTWYRLRRRDRDASEP